MQKVLEKSCFEKKPTSSAFWRVQFHLWRPLHAHSTSSMDTAPLQGTLASLPPGSASAQGSSAQGLASLDLDASVWGAYCSPLTLSPAKPRHALVFSSGLLVIKSQSSALMASFLIAPSVPGRPPLSVSSYLTDSSGPFCRPLPIFLTTFSPAAESAPLSGWIAKPLLLLPPSLGP